MATTSSIVSAGKEQSKIGVLLSYKLVQLFSEGLYTTPNKAIEELVANSFDAGALKSCRPLTSRPQSARGSDRCDGRRREHGRQGACEALVDRQEL